jgi:hypothetical protein
MVEVKGPPGSEEGAIVSIEGPFGSNEGTPTEIEGPSSSKRGPAIDDGVTALATASSPVPGVGPEQTEPSLSV